MPRYSLPPLAYDGPDGLQVNIRWNPIATIKRKYLFAVFALRDAYGVEGSQRRWRPYCKDRWPSVREGHSLYLTSTFEAGLGSGPCHCGYFVA